MKIRVVYFISAFSMSVDIPEIRTVIHDRSSLDMDDYLQEAGHAVEMVFQAMQSYMYILYSLTYHLCSKEHSE